MKQTILLVLLTFSISQSVSAQSYSEVFTDYEVKQINADILYSTVNSTPNGPISIELNGKTMELVRSQILSDEYLSINSDGTLVPSTSRAIPLQGFTSSGGTVSLAVAKNFIYGYYKDGATTTFIEPAKYYNSDAQINEFITYKPENVKDQTEHSCAAIELENNIKNVESSSQSITGVCYEIQWAICNDYSMITKYTNAAGAENHAIGVANNVNTSYDDEFDDEIRFIIEGQYNSTCNGCDPWTSSTNSDILIEDFRVWTNANLAIPHDVASLWTNRDFDGSTIGVAYVGGMCSNSYKVNILQDWSTNASLKRVMVAHELGHNLNAPHDASGSPHIMAPAVNNTTTWSAGSISVIESFYGALSCMTVCSGSTPQVQWTNQFLTIGETGSTGAAGNCNEPFELIQLEVNINIAPTANIVMTASIDGASTAQADFDYELVNSTVTFTPGGSLSKTIDIRIINDQIDETVNDEIVLDLAITSGTATMGPFSTQTITIEDSGDKVSSTCCSGGADITYGNYNYNATTIFNGAFQDARSRVIYLASELTAAGLSAGFIEELRLNVVSKASTGPFNDFRIGLANVSNTDLSGMSWIATTEVYSANHTTATGWNAFPFSNSFYWDGTSNLYVSYCFNNTVAVGGDIIMHTVPTVATSTQMTQFQQNNGTDGCDAIGTNSTSSYTVAIQPRIQLKQQGGAIVETAINATATAQIKAGETANFYSNAKVIGSITNLGTTDIDCADFTIKTAGTSIQNAGFGNGNYSAKTFEITGESTASYEVTLYYTDSELAAWGTDKLNLSMVQSDVALNLANANNVTITSASSSAEIGAGAQVSYKGLFSGPGYFALTNIDEEIIYGDLTDADLVIEEANKGLLMHSLDGTAYRLSANNDNSIAISQTTGDTKASMMAGNLALTSNSYSVILKKPNGTYAKLAVDNDGVPTLSTVTLPADRIELSTGDFAVEQAGMGLILKNSQNECYRLTVDATGVYSTEIDCL